ncbi:hypothetical protein [Methanobrevibacter sp.]|uniref:hypothetical protein n=1 Tax=Methanobrevibacter sp. TaxID=66852 RepID=UPI00388F3524
MDLNTFLFDSVVGFFVILIAFLLIYLLINRLYLRIRDKTIFDIRQYFPEDEIHSLRQVVFLFMMAGCFTYVVLDLVFANVDIWYLATFDFVLSLICFIDLDKSTIKNKILAFLLIPFATVSFLLVDSTILLFFEFAHLIVMLYMIKVYYTKFNEYTKYHGLGIAVILLFAIIFFSMYITAFAENVDLFDALIMSSNAFTSNGYAILGNSILGKLDSLVLVWGGYVISGVSVATLTSAILMRHFNRKFDELEKLIKENNK